jgi:hypothetical protein
MDSYSELKKLDLSPFGLEESVPVSLVSKGLLLSNPTAAERSVAATVKIPGGSANTIITIDLLPYTTQIVNLKISELNASILDTGLSIFELY